MTGGRPLLEIHPADTWADHVADAVAERLAANPDLVVALPTGSTPLPVYERLPAALAAAGASFGAATVVVLDEFIGLPVDHPVRCDAVLRRTLLDRLERPPARFVIFDVDEPDPDAACAAVDDAVAAAGGLDLVILGLGANGHVGMNEPGSAPDAPSRAVDLAPSTIEAARRYGADPAPSRGVTLGMAPILAAREIWLLISGTHKAGILQRTLSDPITSAVPAALLRGHPGLRLIADDRAASGWPARPRS